MPFLNTVHLMGHLTDDLEVRQLPTGNAVVNFTVGVNSGRSKDGKPRKGEFFDCEVWDGWAQNLAKTARKGSLLVVEGRLVQERWIDSRTNKTRSRVRVRANCVFHVQAQYPESRSENDSSTLDEEIRQLSSQSDDELAGELER